LSEEQCFWWFGSDVGGLERNIGDYHVYNQQKHMIITNITLQTTNITSKPPKTLLF
jgi:hypothetical protein